MDVAVTSLVVPPTVAAKEPFLLTATLKATSPAQDHPHPAAQRPPHGEDRARAGRRAPRCSPSGISSTPPASPPTSCAPTPPTTAWWRTTSAARWCASRGRRGCCSSPTSPQGTLARTLARVEPGARGARPRRRSPWSSSRAWARWCWKTSRRAGSSENGLHVLAQFVKEAGGGLVMTGGQHSFGEGGYRKSPVEELLPVSLEVREEQRKAAIAMAIIMDCSCSMGVRVPDGRTKMELAAEGVVGALQLLNPRDEASVDMVDTETHQIFAMSPVAGGLPLDKVARGFSGGGGIYVGVGLRAAKKEILSSDQGDAARAALLRRRRLARSPTTTSAPSRTSCGENVTVSVIGMGSRADSDAKLLEEVARRGNGRIYFAEDVLSLPRIFSQETIAVARSTFVEEKTATKLGPDLAQLGKLPVADAPGVGGYNLTYLKPLASVGLAHQRRERGAGARAVAARRRPGGRAHRRGRRPLHRRVPPVGRATRAAHPVGAVDHAAAGPPARRRGARAAHRATICTSPSTSIPPRRRRPARPPWCCSRATRRLKPLELPMRWEDEDRVGAHFVLPGQRHLAPGGAPGRSALPRAAGDVALGARVRARARQRRQGAALVGGQGRRRRRAHRHGRPLQGRGGVGGGHSPRAGDPRALRARCWWRRSSCAASSRVPGCASAPAPRRWWPLR